MTVRNNGRVTASGATVHLDLARDPSIEVLSETEQTLGDIEPGEVKSARFNIAIRPWSTLEKLEPRITVSEQSFERADRRQIELPFDRRVARRPVVVNRNYYVAAEEAVLRSGASDAASEYARAPRGSVLRAVGELYGDGDEPEWVQVELSVQEDDRSRTETLWADWRSLTTDAPDGAGDTQPVVVTRFGTTPPGVTFVSPTSDLTTSGDRVDLTVNITESRGKLERVKLLAGLDGADLRDVIEQAEFEVPDVEVGENRIVRYTGALRLGRNIFRVVAENDAGKRTERTLVVTREARPDRASRALIVGIEDYLFLGNVPGCREDARAVAETIRRARRIEPGRITLMTCDAEREIDRPSGGAIRRRMNRLAADTGADGMAFFYFSGHGIMRNNELYLIPRDGDRGGGIALREIEDILRNSDAGQQVVVLDVCRPAEEHAPETIKPEASGRVTVFFSCDEDEMSYIKEGGTQSVFSDAFVRALGQAAPEPGRPLTARELQGRIDELMGQWRDETGKDQTPQLRGPGETVIIPPERME